MRSRSYQHDQQSFEAGLSFRHGDSIGFLASVRNSVAKQEFWRSRPKQISKSLAGETLGRVSVSHQARESAARAEANRALLNVDRTLTINDLRLSWDDKSLCNWAQAKAASVAGKINAGVSAEEIRAYIESYGFIWPQYQPDLFGESAALARASDQKWWRRQARVRKVRVLDQLARSFRMVHAKAQPYCSNEAVRLRRSQARRNRLTLEGLEAVNQEGDAYTLAELSDLSVSNPTNRRHELMVRMRGFESIADQFGHVGLFITQSAPSRFHPMRQIVAKGKVVRIQENDKYSGATPREAQEWLNKTWSLIRSAMDRRGIRCYGFRVVEPHADGCPHWHQLLFFSVDQVDVVKKIFRHYALRTDAQEAGAAKYRLKIVDIDKERGSAAGYIAKYISKSIDGTHIDEDLLGNAGFEAAERICAWASSWGVRQFQQIGGPSVTVWRELRRLDGAEGIAEVARAAADASDWAAYFLVQSNGLPFVSRNDAPIRAAYWLEHDAETGEVIDEACNKYGEASRGKLFGLAVLGEYVLTRFYRWTVQRLGAAVKAVKDALPVTTMSPDELLDLLRGDGLNSAA